MIQPNLTHRGSKHKFKLLDGDIHVEIFWHTGYHKLGAAVWHVPTGQWDLVYGNTKTIFKKIRQLAMWLAYPEVRKVSQRILGRKEFRRNDAIFWAEHVDIVK